MRAALGPVSPTAALRFTQDRPAISSIELEKGQTSGKRQTTKSESNVVTGSDEFQGSKKTVTWKKMTTVDLSHRLLD